jgi:hypothetical protein
MHPKVARGRKADLYGQTGIDAVAPIPDLPALATEREGSIVHLTVPVRERRVPLNTTSH